MGQIHITFDSHTLNAVDTPVPVEVYNQKLKRVAGPVVRLVDNGRPVATITVQDPGLYLVRCVLPSGEQLETSVKLASAADEVTARLESEERSPSEQLAWAYASQSVKRASGKARAAQGAGPGGIMAGAAVMPEMAPELAFGLGREAPQGEIGGCYRVLPGQPAWTLATVPGTTWSDSEDLAGIDARLIESHRLTNGEIKPDTPGSWFPLYVRYTLRHAAGEQGQTGLIAVPPVAQATLLFVRADMDTLTGQDIRVLVKTDNPRTEALLAYLSQGAISRARQVAESLIPEAVAMVQEKRTDPVAATVAGYFLLQAGEVREWDWIRNLADWFEQMPDGAVIYAASLLAGPGQGSRREEAGRYLVAAVQRGIPAFTAGLRLLFDNLRQLVEPGDEGGELQKALARVRYIAAYADWDAVTTSIWLPPAIQDPPFRFVGAAPG